MKGNGGGGGCVSDWMIDASIGAGGGGSAVGVMGVGSGGWTGSAGGTVNV